MTELRPAAELVTHIETHYRCVAAGPMAAVPLCNPSLSVRLLGLADWEGVRVGALVMPWAINLLLLPGSAPWQAAPALSKQCWRFPSGEYEFIHAEDVGFGPFQMCSLFSPVLEFDSMDAACATAQAALLALLRPPLEAFVDAPAAEPMSRRRWLFGRGGASAA
ncbi:[NiFe]-hydrogenase assembly chaperone HybE [Zoogloea sp. LCSB751]|uniref:[NiFe]-hydrogenase assembly chaperone HybE n=1 Tax=Zoogloea sp. LCSB751 TaxID=1965277 RepID=UPI0009A50DF6|nr:[NiFe]-hydrogenase assembly chaperone HybE [Zoogloea sp. LCSB751]